MGLLLPGPFATRLLSDLGADVIKVEPPTGDPGTTLLPGLAPFLERGKRAVQIDLKAEGGRELVLDLIATADVVLEGFRPGVADRLGVGFAAASERRPGIIYCSISGYGQDGPMRETPAHDANIEAAAGGYAGAIAIGEEPTTPYMPIADLSASMFAALSITAAIAQRAAGAGMREESVHLDVSMQEALTYFAVPRWGRYLADGVPPQAGDLVAYSPGAGMFRTADGRHVALAAIEDDFWTNLCTGIGRPELAEEPYTSHEQRMAHRWFLRPEIATAITQQQSTGLIETLSARGVPITLAKTVSEVAEDPHLLERGALTREGDGLRLDFPVRQGGRQRSFASPSYPDRELDEQTLLRELGISPEREAGLRASGALKRKG